MRNINSIEVESVCGAGSGLPAPASSSGNNPCSGGAFLSAAKHALNGQKQGLKSEERAYSSAPSEVHGKMALAEASKEIGAQVVAAARQFGKCADSKLHSSGSTDSSK